MEQPLLLECDLEIPTKFVTTTTPRTGDQTVEEHINPLVGASRSTSVKSQEPRRQHGLAATRQPRRTVCLAIWASSLVIGLLLVVAGAAWFVLVTGTDLWATAVQNPETTNEFYWASYTGYHFQPPKNWMNDPNGPMHYKGYYHFFYQYNPDGAVWGKVAWGHAVSTDLIHWTHLELAIMPDEWYDNQGVWSGSATILEDGTPVIMYTGARTVLGSDADQSQNLAYPVDPSDPLLRKWKKADSNPILDAPHGIRPQDFRDPSTAWLENDGFWRLAVGAKRENAMTESKDGISLLYKSKDFVHWEMEERHLHIVNGTGMWECVDFFPVFVNGRNGLNHSVLRAETYADSFKYVLKASLDDTRHDFYAIGTYSTESHTFVPDDPEQDVGLGPRYDYGKFYASKTFYDPSSGRRILWGWANESDSEADDLLKGWASVQAIPRSVWLEQETNQRALLIQWPVKEVEALRGPRANYQAIDLPPASIRKIDEAIDAQLDIVVDFEKPNMSVSSWIDADAARAGNVVDEEFDCSQGGASHRGALGPFGLLLHADDALTEQTAIFFYIEASKTPGEWRTLVCSDQSRSSLAPGIDTTVYGTSVTVLPSEEYLSLRILVDHSIVETFAQNGRLAITSRVYPMRAIGPKSNLFLFNNATSPIVVRSLDVYRMQGANTHHV